MKQATKKLYIRFGEIPEDKKSKVHRSDAIIRDEGGLSVWRAIQADGEYYPMLPEDANESAIADYFSMLLSGKKKIYLVTGTEMFLEGADREPLLMDDIQIIKELNYDYLRNM